MRKAKVAVTVDEELIRDVDLLVGEGRFPSRSALVQEAVRDKLGRLHRSRLAMESAKLDPAEERTLAEEGLQPDADAWPDY